MVANTKTKDKKSTKKLKVVLLRSVAGCNAKQIACVRGLGLRKIRHERELEYTPAVRGMINKVKHMVAVL